jgi:hypothetical protein
LTFGANDDYYLIILVTKIPGKLGKKGKAAKKGKTRKFGKQGKRGKSRKEGFYFKFPPIQLFADIFHFSKSTLTNKLFLFRSSTGPH